MHPPPPAPAHPAGPDRTGLEGGWPKAGPEARPDPWPDTWTATWPDAPAPRTELVWRARVRIAARQDLGAGPAGRRFLVPILGGVVEGRVPADCLAPGTAQPARWRAQVLPGGADRQLLRPDGIKALDALYELQTEDGCVLTVRNRVLIDEAAQPERYVFSQLRVQAPEGPYAWLNRRVFVGTLESLPPEAQAVCIRVWQLRG